MAIQNANNENSITYGQMNLINTMRKLWMELPMWRRAFLVSYSAGLSDVNVIGNRLYYAPTKIGDVLEVFLGRSAARTIEGMIREQVVILSEILRAQKDGNRAAIDESTRRLYENVGRMASYMAEVNPYWDGETWRGLLYEYYETSILEMVLVLAGKNEEGVTLYESLQNQALNIADYMVEGLIPYFSEPYNNQPTHKAGA